MSEKLPIAIEAIKAGNKQLGQQLLAQILQSDPNNEQAWLWMSAVVDEDKRKYCIERVLRINPNNVIASQALSQLNQKKNSQKTKNEHSTSIPEPSSPSISQKKEKQSNFEDVQKPSIVLTVTKDGFKMGLIGGVLGVIFAYIFRFLFDSPPLAATTIFGACISANITSGIIFFRRGIGANLSVSFGGFVSGFVSGAITSLGYGIVSLVAPILLYLAFCGLFTPLLFAVLGSIIIWIPRLFINPTPENYKENFTPNKQVSRETGKSTYTDTLIMNAPPVAKTIIEDQLIATPVVQENAVNPTDSPKFWIYPTRRNVFVFSLTESDIHIASGPIGSLQKVKNSILQSKSTEQFLKDKKNIPYKNITKVRQILSTIRIYYTNGSQETSRALDCKDTKMANELIDFLRNHIRSQFDETNKPVGIGTSLFTSGFIMLVVLAGTAFFYYGAYELEAGIISPRGSARTRAILNLLDLLGTNGVLVIGTILFILSLGLMFYLIKNPPTVTEFIKKGEQKIEEATPAPPLQPELPKNTVLSKPEQVIPVTPQAKTGAILIDGLLSGLILGVIGMILPGISIFTGEKQLAQWGMYLDGFLMLFSGVLTGILFQGRDIGKSQSTIFGGAIAGALTGLLSGVILGLSAQNETITNMATQDGLKIYIMVCMVSPSIGGAFVGAFSAWMFGLTSKESAIPESNFPLTQKTAGTQANADPTQDESITRRFGKILKRRLILAAILGVIVFVCALCQSLIGSL